MLGVQLRRSGKLVGHVGLSPFGRCRRSLASRSKRPGNAKVSPLKLSAQCATGHATCFRWKPFLASLQPGNAASQGVLLRAGFTWQKDDVMQFQGVEQPVIFFAFSRKLERMAPWYAAHPHDEEQMTKIVQTRYVIAVPNLQASARFYSDVLGFTVHKVADPDGSSSKEINASSWRRMPGRDSAKRPGRPQLLRLHCAHRNRQLL